MNADAMQSKRMQRPSDYPYYGCVEHKRGHMYMSNIHSQRSRTTIEIEIYHAETWQRMQILIYEERKHSCDGDMRSIVSIC